MIDKFVERNQIAIGDKRAAAVVDLLYSACDNSRLTNFDVSPNLNSLTRLFPSWERPLKGPLADGDPLPAYQSKSP